MIQGNQLMQALMPLRHLQCQIGATGDQPGLRICQIGRRKLLYRAWQQADIVRNACSLAGHGCDST